LEREYVGTLRFLGSQTKVIPLRAKARSLWRVLPAQIELLPGGESPSPMIMVKNFLLRPLEVTLHGPEGMELPAEIAVPAEGEVSFPVRRREDFLGGSEGEVVLTSELGRLAVPVRIFPFPAKLAVKPSGRIDLSEGASAGQEIELSNLGGLPGEVRWDLPEFLRSDTRSPLLLAPGETRRVKLFLRSLGGAPLAYSLGFRLGNEVQTIELRLPDTLAASNRTVRPILPHADRPIPFSPEQSDEPPPEPETPESFRELQLHHREKHKLVFAFQDATAGVARHRLEKREIAPNGEGELEVVWREFPPTVVEDGPEGSRRFTLQGLPAGARLHLRVVSLDEAGRVLAQTPPFSLATLAPEAGWWPSPSVWIPTILLGGGIWWILRRRRQRLLLAAAEDRRRIEALEGEGRS
jgi:hypothetical protein